MLRFGFALEYAGDWDHDGLPDLVVGAPGGAASAFTYPGTVYIIPGASILAASVNTQCVSGPPVVRVDQLAGVDIWTVSSTTRDRFGYSVAFAGDVGDDQLGFTDIIVGTPQFSVPATGGAETYDGSGYARVLLGSPGKHAVLLQGAALGDTFGISVDGNVDLNADGKSDVLVGAPQWDDPQTPLTNAGRSYAFSMSQQPVFSAISVRQGDTAEEFFGFTVTGLGAFAGSGSASHYYAVCSRKFGMTEVPGACPVTCFGHESTAAGRVCGKATVYQNLSSLPCFAIVGEDSKDSAGWSMAALADLDDPADPSGAPEFVLTSPRWGPTGVLAERGRIYVFLR